jgi:hypothetical protein
MKLFGLLALAWLLGLMAPLAVRAGAPAAVSARPQPRIAVAQPVYDFGSVPQGPSISHSFTIKNVGQAELLIGQVQSTCGCTIAALAQKSLRPGQSTQVLATFDTRHERGKASRQIDVYSNDPRTPDLALTMEGVITVAAEAVPSEVNFGDLRKGTGATREVAIRRLRKGAQISIVKVSNTNSHIAIARQSGGPDAVARLELTVRPDMPAGPFEDTIELTTNDQPIEIPLYGRVVGDLRVEPAQVSFGILPHGQSAVRYVRVVNSGARPVTIVALSSTNPAVSVTAKPLAAGRQYRLALALRGGTADGQLHGQLQIKTDDPQQPQLTVPFFGIIGSFKTNQS